MAIASSPIKKSRSSTPRFEARFPGFDGIGGPARVGWAAAPPRVAMAVGKTLDIYSQQANPKRGDAHLTYNEGSELPAKLSTYE